MKYLLFFLSLAIACILFNGISYFFLKDSSHDIESLIVKNAPLFVNGRLDLWPEPGERRIFLFGIIFLPFVSAVNYLLLTYTAKKNLIFRNIISDPYLNLATAWSGLIFFLWLLTFIISDLFKTKEQNFYFIFHTPLHYFLIFIFLGILLVFGVKIIKTKNTAFFLLGIISIILTSLYPLMPEKYFYKGWSTTHHFDQIFNLIIQAYHGKTSLVDFVSQYGVIYPHAAELFLKIFSFNFFTVNLFFTLLAIISFIFLYLTIAQKSGVKSLYSLLILLSLLGISQTVYLVFGLRNPPETLYYQYLPIRVITPALFLFFVLRYLKKENRIKYYLGFFLSAISILWNADTGMVILISWLALLCFNSFLKYKLSLKLFTETLYAVFSALFFTGLVFGSYTLFSLIRSGVIPDWNGLFELHRIYYLTGNFMMPMPKIGIWYLPATVYLAYIVHSLITLLTGKANLWNKFYFFLSLMGIGLFSYYQGRSALTNLIVVIYPAVILSGYFIHDFITEYQISPKNLKRLFLKSNFHFHLMAVIPTIALIGHGLLNVAVWSLPALNTFRINWTSVPPETELSNQIEQRTEFVRKNRKTDKFMIIAEDSSYIHIKTNTYSSLPYGFYLEVNLKSQADKIKNKIKSGQIEQVFTDYNWSNWTGYKLANYLVEGETDPAYLQKFYELP